MLLRPASKALLRNGDAGLLPERQGQSGEPERPVPQVILARRGALDPRGHAVSLIVKRPSVVGNMGARRRRRPGAHVEKSSSLEAVLVVVVVAVAVAVVVDKMTFRGLCKPRNIWLEA